jgi:TonB family protein
LRADFAELPVGVESLPMQACTYLNAFAGAVVVALSSFAACGGSAPPASSPSSASTESIAAAASADPAPSAPGAASASPSPTPAAAAASAAPAPQPDRNMNDIRAVVAGNRESFRACYDKSLKAHPDIKGTFVLSFVLNPDGTVKSAQADQSKSQIHTADLETCAVATLKTLKFPPSRKGMESTVNYPFDFNPKGPPPKTGSASPSP